MNISSDLRFTLYGLRGFFPGDHSEEVTPVPIPNTEVKGLCGDGTATLGCGRVARCREYFLRAVRFVGQPSFFCHEPARDRMVGNGVAGYDDSW